MPYNNEISDNYKLLIGSILHKICDKLHRSIILSGGGISYLIGLGVNRLKEEVFE